MLTNTTGQPSRTVVRPSLLVLPFALAGAWVVVAWPPLSLAVVAALVPLTAAAAVDAVEHRLPDRLVAPAAVPVVIVCCADVFVDRMTVVGGALLGALLLAAPLLVTHLIAPAGMGFGDVKAAAALGATLGMIEPALALWTLCIASAATAAWGIVRRRRHVAFGPALVMAAVGVLLVAASMGLEDAAWR